MTGTLEAGKFADLVVVDGDPVADVAVLQVPTNIRAVMKGGVIYRGLANAAPYEAADLA